MSSSIPLDLLDQLNDLLTSDSTSADMLKSVYDTGGSSGSAAVDLADGILGGSSAGNSKYYGTSPTGVLGFNNLPSADMLKSVYDPNNDGLISAAQLDSNIILIPLQRGWFL